MGIQVGMMSVGIGACKSRVGETQLSLDWRVRGPQKGFAVRRIWLA